MTQSLRGYAQQELTILTIFLLVFTHKRTYEQQFLVTMSTSTNKHRHKNKLLGILLPPPQRKTWREISNFIVKNILSHVHRQFNDRYINSFIINVRFRRYIFFKVELHFNILFNPSAGT